MSPAAWSTFTLRALLRLVRQSRTSAQWGLELHCSHSFMKDPLCTSCLRPASGVPREASCGTKLWSPPRAHCVSSIGQKLFPGPGWYFSEMLGVLPKF